MLRATLPATIESRQDINADKAMVLADPAQKHYIVMNLVTNAAHAMRRYDRMQRLPLARSKRCYATLGFKPTEPSPIHNLNPTRPTCLFPVHASAV